jgi:hypothetical protein
LGSLFFILFAIILGTTEGLAQIGDSPPERVRYFEQTGHTVEGDFLATYESASNPELIYGYPISEAYQDQRSGRFIQYFERARFERFPEKPPELRVYITPLGKLLYEHTAELANPRSIPGCRYFPEAKFYVCYDFLDFFNANGGTAQFGYPISNFEIRDGWIVQNFQRARFEWHPELPSGQKVQLTKLGKQYFDLMGENPARLRPVHPPVGSDIVQPLLDLNVRASFLQAITHTSGEQTIYISVQDQKLMPLANATVTLDISLPSGETNQIIVPQPTDKYGITKFTFDFENLPPGLVRVIVAATYNLDNQGNALPGQNLLSDKTIASFLVWW